MSRNLMSVSLVAMLAGGAAWAESPNVSTDIAPIHSLVARVMEGVGTPDLIVKSGASPHEYSLRPSEAAALQDADLVFWVGEDLTPWMADAVDTLASDAAVTTLMDVEGAMILDFRENASFEAHDHDHADHDDHDKHDDHDHDDDDHEAHDDDHEDHTEHDDHDHDGHEDDAHADHDHGEHDPHAWLSIKNAALWMNTIADELAAADPDNAEAYQANATAAQAELNALTNEISNILDPVRGGGFVVFHDAYQYFETDFDFPAFGAISLSDATDPSPARVAEIRERIAEEGISCVLAEPQFNQGLVATVMDGTTASTGVIDPLGASLEPGPALYTQLMRNMAQTLADCLR